MDFLNYEFFGVTLLDWLIAIGIGLGIALVLMVLRSAIAGRFERLASRTSNVVDDVIVVLLKSTRRYSFFAIGLWAATLFKEFPGDISQLFGRIVFLVLLFQIGVWGTSVIRLVACLL